MLNTENTIIPELLEKHRSWLVDNWLERQRVQGAAFNVDEAERRAQSARFVDALRVGRRADRSRT
jgi:hypothetical protein